MAQYGFQGGQIKRWQVASMQVAKADFTPQIAFICHLRPSTCHLPMAMLHSSLKRIKSLTDYHELPTNDPPLKIKLLE